MRAGECEEVFLDKRYFLIIEIRLVTIPGARKRGRRFLLYGRSGAAVPEPRSKESTRQPLDDGGTFHATKRRKRTYRQPCVGAVHSMPGELQNRFFLTKETVL